MYTIDFVGLACFSKQDGQGRFVLLPDGREPGEGIDAHIPRLVVKTEDVQRIDKELTTETIDGGTEVLLPKCLLRFSGADTNDKKETTLDTTDHDRFLQQLSEIDPTFDADDIGGTVVRLRIRKGTLKAYRFPGSDELDPAVVSRLQVPHDDWVSITIVPEPNGKPATVLLKPGSEVVLANTAPRHDDLNQRSHFLIYERLSSRRVDFSKRPAAAAAGPLQHLSSHNPFFRSTVTSGAGGDCGNTGCCKP